jgi:disulfide bond formation protein DsbB
VFPFADVLNALFMGDGNCAEIPWQFLGLSMAGWSLIFFIVIVALSFFALLRTNFSN